MNTKGENLIFLVSQPRAGSTLLQLLLSGHPDIATTSEPWVALHPLFALRDHGVDTVYNPAWARQAVLCFLKQSGTNEDFYRNGIRNFLLSLYNRSIDHQKKKFFLDKTPRYYLVLPDLIKIFPEAKFIILFRNPLAVLNSIFKSWISDDYSKLGEFKDDLVFAPKILMDCTKLSGSQCFSVKYEELVTDPKDTLQKVCSFIGISFVEDMLNYEKNIRPDWHFGDSIGIFKTNRPVSGSLESWRKGFRTPQERFFAVSYIKVLGPELINEMGYDYDMLLSSIQIPEKEQGLISWQTIMSEVGEFSKTKEVREIVRQIFLDEDFLNENSTTSNENLEWKEIVKSAAKWFRDDRLYSLRRDIDALNLRMSMLKTERDESIAKMESMRAERDGLKAENADLVAERDGLKAENADLVAERDGLKAENADLVAERDGLKAENADLVAERDELNAENDSLKQERTGLIDEIETIIEKGGRFEGEADILRAELDTLKLERAKLDIQMKEFLNSYSWKVTAPLRKIMMLFIKYRCKFIL